VVSTHRAVLDAIEARDAASARDITQQHVDARTRWLVELRLRPAAPRTARAAGARQEVDA
jgi:DNA-binding GntR family transcriptional regulator